jgi:drug/metabolite transporter (DMT)-like permease
MSTTVVLVVLGAGLIHAIWNAMAKSIHDQFVSFALLNLGVAVVCWVAWPFIGLPRSAAFVYLGFSIACHVGYELFLMGAYRRANFSQSYPIARGIAPLLVSVAGLLFASEHLSARGLLGIFGIVLGIISLAFRRGGGLSNLHGVYWALATGVAIASYTVVDGLGVRASHSAPRYAAMLFAIESFVWLIGVVARQHRGWWPGTRVAAIGMGAGVLSMVGYVTVLWAQLHAPLGVVSALRETGVLWAALIGVVVFREGRLRRIVLPAALVVAGIALLSIG